MRELFVITAVIAAATFAARCANIVENGQPKAEIVVPEKPLANVKFAAEDLQKHLEAISGAKLAIVSEPSGKVKSRIFVGRSPLTDKLGVTTDDLKAGGFKIVVKGDDVVIVGKDVEYAPFPFNPKKKADVAKWRKLMGGNLGVRVTEPGKFNKELGFFTLDDTATLYAVADFLEQLGVRFYMPYEIGTVIPKESTIIVPEQSIKKEPAFPYREFTYSRAMQDDAEGVAWFKRLKYGCAYFLCDFQNIHNVFDYKLLGESNPEYFAHQGGEPILDRKGRGVARLGNEKFRQASSRYLRGLFDAYPDVTCVGLHMPMGFQKIDENDAKNWPVKRKSEGAQRSDYVWDYWIHLAKELKKTHPDKYLVGFAHANYKEPPANVDKLPDNLLLLLSYPTKSLRDPVYRKFLRDMREKWLSMLASKKMIVYERFGVNKSGKALLPIVFTKLLQEETRRLDGVSDGKLFEVGAVRDKAGQRRISCYALNHLYYYLQGKLYWNPDLDLEKTLDEYYRLFFGPAADEMREFHEFAEEVWMRPESHHVSLNGGYLRPEDGDKFFDILARAKAKAGADTDTVYGERIAMIEEDMSPMRTVFNNLKRTGPDVAAPRLSNNVTIDGVVEETPSKKDHWHRLLPNRGGEPSEENATDVAINFNQDATALVIRCVCRENDMANLVAKVTENDHHGIFYDDVIEIYVETPTRSYFKMVVNPNGAVWDETFDHVLINRDGGTEKWSPGIKAAAKKYDDRWALEVEIPLRDFGPLPTMDEPWGINVCRTRFTGGEPSATALSPTGGKYATLNKMANLRP